MLRGASISSYQSHQSHQVLSWQRFTRLHLKRRRLYTTLSFEFAWGTTRTLCTKYNRLESPLSPSVSSPPCLAYHDRHSHELLAQPLLHYRTPNIRATDIQTLDCQKTRHMNLGVERDDLNKICSAGDETRTVQMARALMNKNHVLHDIT